MNSARTFQFTVSVKKRKRCSSTKQLCRRGLSPPASSQSKPDRQAQGRCAKGQTAHGPPPPVGRQYLETTFPPPYRYALAAPLHAHPRVHYVSVRFVEPRLEALRLPPLGQDRVLHELEHVRHRFWYPDEIVGTMRGYLRGPVGLERPDSYSPGEDEVELIVRVEVAGAEVARSRVEDVHAAVVGLDVVYLSPVVVEDCFSFFDGLAVAWTY
mmetsp:Transcript_38472/g.92111  ORF Transcript_38472/g.92111 Transcript_38472/m.92111 type:complete len:212 (-) Transcript_38472:407-1042(-)